MFCSRVYTLDVLTLAAVVTSFGTKAEFPFTVSDCSAASCLGQSHHMSWLPCPLWLAEMKC